MTLRRWMMGKKAKAARREAIRLRASNGQASLRELDMLSRMSNEAKGKDGYTGESKGSSSYGFQGSSYQGKTGHTFTTISSKEDGVFRCEDSGELTKECPI